MLAGAWWQAGAGRHGTSRNTGIRYRRTSAEVRAESMVAGRLAVQVHAYPPAGIERNAWQWSLPPTTSGTGRWHQQAAEHPHLAAEQIRRKGVCDIEGKNGPSLPTEGHSSRQVAVLTVLLLLLVGSPAAVAQSYRYWRISPLGHHRKSSVTYNGVQCSSTRHSHHSASSTHTQARTVQYHILQPEHIHKAQEGLAQHGVTVHWWYSHTGMG